MWKCPKCSESVEDSFDSCWNCGTGKDGSPPPANFGAIQEDEGAQRAQHSTSAAIAGSTVPRSRPDTTPTYKSEGAQSVVARLRVVAGFIKIIWAIAGLVICAVLGTALAGNDTRALGGTVGALLGGALGYLFGSLTAVFVDWSCEMLLLQEKTYYAVSKGKKG